MREDQGVLQTVGALSGAGLLHPRPRGGSVTNHPMGEAHKSGVASPLRIADLITVGVQGERVEAL